MTKVACYDNPHTMCREAHIDGKIKMGMTASMLMTLPKDFALPFQINHGPWNPGQIIGDPEAIDRTWGE